MLVCVSTHTAVPLAYSGFEVFSFPIVMSLANDSIWFLICKIHQKKKKLVAQEEGKHGSCF